MTRHIFERRRNPARQRNVRPAADCRACGVLCNASGDLLCPRCWRVVPLGVKRAYVAAWRAGERADVLRLEHRVVRAAQRQTRGDSQGD